MSTTPEQLSVRLHVPAELAGDLRAELEELGAADVQVEEPRPGIAPLLIVAAAVLGAHGLAELIMRIHDKGRCQQRIDARGDEIKSTVDCSVRDGRIIVITRGDEQVEIVDPPKGIDLTEVMKAAVSGGAAAVRRAAEDAGARTA